MAASVPNVMPLPEKPVATNWLLGRLADVGQAVVRFDHLARPAVSRPSPAGTISCSSVFQPCEAVLGVVLLARLVVLAAEDQANRAVGSPIDAEVVVGIGRVPEAGLGELSLAATLRRPRS